VIGEAIRCDGDDLAGVRCSDKRDGPALDLDQRHVRRKRAGADRQLGLEGAASIDYEDRIASSSRDPDPTVPVHREAVRIPALQSVDEGRFTHHVVMQRAGEKCCLGRGRDVKRPTLSVEADAVDEPRALENQVVAACGRIDPKDPARKKRVRIDEVGLAAGVRYPKVAVGAEDKIVRASSPFTK